MDTDENILSACYEGLIKAERNPKLKQQLLQREGELRPRFAEHYEQLKHLPRRMRRSLQRYWKRSLAGIALLLALGQTPAMAATINVGGACTLVRAISSANLDAAVGGCAKGSGADRIVMPRNSTVTLTAVNNTTYGATGLPTIRGTVTIDGNGSTIKRAASAPKFRILTVGLGSTLRLEQTTVTGGMANGQMGNGGGLINFSTLSLAGSTISGNRASGDGGGVSTSYYAGRLTVTNSTISGNSSGSRGGGVSSEGRLTVTNSTISGNTAASSGGGGLYIAGPSTLTNSTISHNSADSNGGGVSSAVRLTVTNSTISGNSSGNGGGGVFNDYEAPLLLASSTISSNTARYAGGVLNNKGNLTVTNSTISGNSATGGGGFNTGGGITNGGVLTVTNSTISGNSAANAGGLGNAYGGSVYLTRALISGNTASRGQEVFEDTNDGNDITAGNFNLFGHQGETNAQAFLGFTPSGTDITATSNGNKPTALNRILNTALDNNGGPTRTHALVAGSPAVDAVNDGTCPPPARDQRGVRRPRDGNGDGGPACDIGSFER